MHPFSSSLPMLGQTCRRVGDDHTKNRPQPALRALALLGIAGAWLATCTPSPPYADEDRREPAAAPNLSSATGEPSEGGAESPEPATGFALFQESLKLVSLQQEAQRHMKEERWEDAIAALEQVVEISSRLPASPVPELTHTQLSNLYIFLGDHPAAVDHERRRLAIVERRGASDAEIATALLDLGLAERMAGDSAAAEHLERALALRARLFGEEHPETAEIYEALGVFYQEREERSKARELLERARAIKERHLPPDDPRLATVYVNLATVYRSEGRLEEARELLEKALAIGNRRGSLGPIDLAVILGTLGHVQWELGEWEEAKASLRRAIELTTSVVGPDHPQLITDLANLAHVHNDLGELTEAEELLRRASDIAHRTLGASHRLTLEAVHSLGTILMMAGKWEESRALLTRNLSERESLLGEDHVDTAVSRVVLGQLLAELGSPDHGFALMAEAILDLATAGRLEDPIVTEVILYAVDTMVQFRLSAKERLEAQVWNEVLTDVRVKFETVYGPDSLKLAGVYEVFAKSALASGNPHQAREFHDRVRRIHDALGLEIHPAKAVYFGNEASIRRALGDLSGALEAMERAVELFVRIYGRESIRAAQVRIDLASLLEATGEIGRARDFLVESLTIEEQVLTRVLAAGSEADQRRFLRTLYDSSILAVSFHHRSAPHDQLTLRLALETVLRRKGRDLDAAVLRARLVRESSGAEIEEMRGELRRLRSLWTRNLISGEHKPEVSWAKIEELERRLADAAGAAALPTATIAEVQRALPPDAALVEIVAVEMPDVVHDRNEDKRYLAYLLPAKGDPQYVDLGVAEHIDRAVTTFLDALTQRDRSVGRAARELDALTLARLRPRLADVRTLLISPEGELLRVPFAALVDEQGRYIVARYAISYVTSGRDLVALREPRESPREKPWVFADPDFARAGIEAPGVLDRLALSDLPGSQEEALEVGELLRLPPERILIGPHATERAVKQVRGPLVLHLATHGFLLPEPESHESDRLQRGLVRSGLALAVEHDRDGEPADDGFLSALELAELDLAGTEIAVLSACDTGRGEFMDGFGLFGLRRALALAGARTQVTSLWSVDDRATADLMRSWYAQIINGVPRGEAWRRTQLAAITGSDLPELGRPVRGTKPKASDESEALFSSHPYYWAAFILSGDTGPVSGMQAVVLDVVQRQTQSERPRRRHADQDQRSEP